MRPRAPIGWVSALQRGEMRPQVSRLEDDAGERNDLLEQYPEVAGKLKDLLRTSQAAGHTR